MAGANAREKERARERLDYEASIDYEASKQGGEGASSDNLHADPGFFDANASCAGSHENQRSSVCGPQSGAEEWEEVRKRRSESLPTRFGFVLLNILQGLFLAVWTTFLFLITVLLIPLTGSRKASLATPRVLWAPALLKIGGVRLEVEQDVPLDFNKPHIFLMNHQSMVDILIGFVVIKSNLRFIAKKVLAYVPCLGWYMVLMGMIFVDRRNTDRAIASLRRAGERIRSGASVIAFPEGTRSKDSRMLPFKKGVFMVAIEAGVPVVPVVVEGAYRVLGRDGFRVRPGSVRVRIGRPIPTSNLEPQDRDAFIRRIRDTMIDMHLSIGGAGGDRTEAIARRGHVGGSAQAASRRPSIEEAGQQAPASQADRVVSKAPPEEQESRALGEAEREAEELEAGEDREGRWQWSVQWPKLSLFNQESLRSVFRSWYNREP